MEEPTMSEEKKCTKWFEENCVSNPEELEVIGDTANRLLLKNISLGLNDPKATIAIYCRILQTICEVIRDKESDYDEFCVNVANRFKIGYTTTDNEDDEKQGNFMVFMQHCDTPTSDTPIDDSETDTIQLCVQWNATNIKSQPEVLKECSSRAKKELSEMLNIKTDSAEFIIPMFCIIHSAIVEFVTEKLTDESVVDYDINVGGLYHIGAEKVEDGIHVYYVPDIAMKLLFKNDEVATGVNE